MGNNRQNDKQRFMSTGAFFNNSAIASKFIWSEKTNLLYFKIYPCLSKNKRIFRGRRAKRPLPKWQSSFCRCNRG